MITWTACHGKKDRIGGLKVTESDITIGKVSYPTIVYGWQDLKTLIERLKR